MRRLGWFLTALGIAGLVGTLALLTFQLMGFSADAGDFMVGSFFMMALSALLIIFGVRLRARGKPLLPISL
ncbi:hypothetical protein ACIP1G_04930 [Pseudomonas sp. NPDC089392]|uniref:hypothetical protein n=1 Tax=Pseudomonas sp. NPDC089392 TaxID=3364459 RepID=UPI0038294468